MKSCGTGSLPVYMYRELKSFEVSLLYVQQPQIRCLGGKTDFLAPYREEEDSAEETLLRDPPSDQRPP